MEELAEHSAYAKANLARARIIGDGVRKDLNSGRSALNEIVDSGNSDPELMGFVHNILGEVESGQHGGKADTALAISHFLRSANFGNAQSAFNAGLLMEKSPRSFSAEQVNEAYRIGADLGHAFSMTNLALRLFRTQDPEVMDEVITLLEEAADLGDAHAAGFLEALDGEVETLGFVDKG